MKTIISSAIALLVLSACGDSGPLVNESQITLHANDVSQVRTGRIDEYQVQTGTRREMKQEILQPRISGLVQGILNPASSVAVEREVEVPVYATRKTERLEFQSLDNVDDRVTCKLDVVLFNGQQLQALTSVPLYRHERERDDWQTMAAWVAAPERGDSPSQPMHLRCVSSRNTVIGSFSARRLGRILRSMGFAFSQEADPNTPGVEAFSTANAE